MTDDNGLYYMRSRYYNPDIKRFINQDILTGSIGNSASLNRYSYVEGNPVSYTDPFGLSPYGNFGTFLNVMNLLSNIELSNEDKKLLRHAILDIVGTLPGGWIADVANALLYFKERNYEEGIKSLFYAIPGMDLAAKATKYAAKFGKLSDKAELLIKSVDFIGHTGAIMFSASDFGDDVEYMIDKYMVGEAEFSYQTIIELVSLGGHGLQLSCFSRSFLDNVSSGAYDSLFTGLSEKDFNLKSLFGFGTDWDIRYNNQGGATLPIGPEGAGSSNKVLGGRFKDVDASRGTDEVGHHMPQNAYEKSIGISRDDGPALLMSKEDHALTRSFAGRGKATMKEDVGLSARQRLSKDLWDIKNKFGTKYNDGIKQMLEYAKTMPEFQK